MTKGFLESGEFNDVNEHFNVCTDGKYTYSPTMYVQYGLYQSNKEYHADLVTLPKYYQERYWKNHGNQPDNMINHPDTIQEEHLKRVAEQKRRDKIREDADLPRRKHTQKRELQNREFEMNKYHEKDCNMRAFNHAKSMSQLELDTNREKNRLQLAFQGDKYSKLQRQRGLEEYGRKNAIEDKRRLLKARIELVREIRRATDAEREHQERTSNLGLARITEYAYDDDDSDGETDSRISIFAI
ncbi:hypothetical protein V8E51_010066 [Hyaloscypha variabilis]